MGVAGQTWVPSRPLSNLELRPSYSRASHDKSLSTLRGLQHDGPSPPTPFRLIPCSITISPCLQMALTSFAFLL